MTSIETEGYTSAWEFSDPVMQADADLRKQIADLEQRNQEQEREIGRLEMEVVHCHQVNDLFQWGEKELASRADNLREAIEQSVTIRTITYRDQIIRLRIENGWLRQQVFSGRQSA